MKIEISFLPCQGGPRDYPPPTPSPPGQEDAKTQQIVVLIAVVYFSKRLKAKSARGKVSTVGTRENLVRAFTGFQSVESHKMYFAPSPTQSKL